MRGGGGGGVASAPTSPLKTRISWDPCNTSRDLAAPLAIAVAIYHCLFCFLAVSVSNLAIAVKADVRKSLVALGSAIYAR